MKNAFNNIFGYLYIKVKILFLHFLILMFEREDSGCDNSKKLDGLAK